MGATLFAICFVFAIISANLLTNTLHPRFDMSTTNSTGLDASRLTQHLDLSDTERWCLTSYFSLILMASLVGNGAILAGSFRKGSMKADRVTVAFLECLAGLDTMIALFHGVPVLVAVIAQEWVLGRVACFLNAYVARAMYINEVLVTVSISCYRLWMLKKPKAVRMNIKLVYVRVYLGVLFVLSVAGSLYSIKSGGFASFNPYLLSCTPVVLESNPIRTAVGGIIILAVPMVTIVVANIMIIIIVNKQNRALQKSALAACAMRTSAPAILPKRVRRGFSTTNQSTFITISLVCWVFVLSYLPTILIACFIGAHFKPPGWFSVLCVSVLSLNIAANPLVYTATNKSFRESVFPRMKLRDRFLRQLTRSATQKSNLMLNTFRQLSSSYSNVYAATTEEVCQNSTQGISIQGNVDVSTV